MLDRALALQPAQQGHPMSLLHRVNHWMDELMAPDWPRLPAAPQPTLGSGLFPVTRVDSDEAQVVVRMSAPGLDPAQLGVYLERDTLHISGEMNDADALPPGWARGRFSKTLTLPARVDADKVETSADKGVITLTLPRLTSERPRRIELK